MPWKVVSAPFDHAESNGNLRLLCQTDGCGAISETLETRQQEKFAKAVPAGSL